MSASSSRSTTESRTAGGSTLARTTIRRSTSQSATRCSAPCVKGSPLPAIRTYLPILPVTRCSRCSRGSAPSRYACTVYYFLSGSVVLFYSHVPSQAPPLVLFTRPSSAALLFHFIHTSLLCVHHTGLVQPLPRRWRALTAARPPPLQAQHLPLPIAKQRRQEAIEAPWHPTASRHYNQPSSTAIAERNNAAARASRLRRAAPLSASLLLARLNFQRD